MSSTAERAVTAGSGDYRVVDVLGQRVRVHIRPGDSSAPPLVLCNGIGASLEALDGVVAALPSAIEVIRFDVPGTGSSSAPAYPYRLAGMAILVTRMLTKLGYHQFDILGYSWGGTLAQQIACQYPRRCRRLVLAATTTGSVAVPGDPRALSKMFTPRRHRDPDYAAEIAGTLYGGSMRDDPTSAARLLGEPMRAGTSRGYLLQLMAVTGWTSLPWLRLIRQPTLLLFGDDDPIIPTVNGRIMAALLPRATLVVFRGGHLELVADPHTLCRRIGEFLTADTE